MGAPYIESIALNLMVATEMCCSLEERRNERKLVAADHLPEAQKSYKKKIILLEDSEIWEIAHTSSDPFSNSVGLYRKISD